MLPLTTLSLSAVSNRPGLSDATLIDIEGGTAGLALACRLTECGDQTVLVLEAGSSPAQVASYRAPGADPQTRG